MESTLIFALESPHYHLLRDDGLNRFSGYVFDYRSKPLKAIKVYRDQQWVGSFPLDLSSEDIHQYLPQIPATRNCRFAFDLQVDLRATLYALEVVYADDSIAEVIPYRVSLVRERRAWFEDLGARLAAIPTPSADLVYATQGVHDRDAYRNSIIPGVNNMLTYLTESAVETARINSILDIGCGTGRLLAGWHLENSQRRLSGCDINITLINWARLNLPGSMDFRQNDLLPPLPYETGQFELVYLVSVFTHLALETQRLWIGEIARILAPDGILLITLHGDIFLELLQPGNLSAFRRDGYLETVNCDDEGSNNYGTYHSPEFVKALFQGFEVIGYFPRGNAEDRVLFPVAGFQDVYVLRKPA